MRFVKILAIFSTVADLSCISKRIFNGTGFLNEIIEKNGFWKCIYLSYYFLYNFMKFPQCLVWKCFKQCINVRFVSIVYSLTLSISKLTYFEWKAITAVFTVNGGVFVASKKMMHLVKFQFHMLYINFWSEHLFVQFDGICFSSISNSCWYCCSMFILGEWCICTLEKRSFIKP